MLKGIARKEFRELLPFIAVALLAQFYLIVVATSAGYGFLAWVFRFLPVYVRTDNTLPFVDDSTCSLIFLVAGLLAVVAGFWQTAWESNRGTLQFLLHRPVRREAILMAKLAVGGLVCLLVAVLPLTYYALWAATPGNRAAPFFWSMTIRFWLLCVQMPLLYLGAFLSGLRPARWFGSRLFPLFCGILLLVILQGFSDVLVSALFQLAGTLLLEICFVLAILHLGKTRDFS